MFVILSLAAVEISGRMLLCMYVWVCIHIYVFIDRYVFVDVYLLCTAVYKTKARARIVQAWRTTTTSKVVIGSYGAPALQLAIS